MGLFSWLFRKPAPSAATASPGASGSSGEAATVCAIVIPFFDADANPDAVTQGNVLVDRVFALNREAFEDSHWGELGRIFEQLPGEARVRGDRREINVVEDTYWFGTEENAPPWLKAVCKLSQGVKVDGCLSVADWRAWQAAFVARVAHFPVYTADQIAEKRDKFQAERRKAKEMITKCKAQGGHFFESGTKAFWMKCLNCGFTTRGEWVGPLRRVQWMGQPMTGERALWSKVYFTDS